MRQGDQTGNYAGSNDDDRKDLFFGKAFEDLLHLVHSLHLHPHYFLLCRDHLVAYLQKKIEGHFRLLGGERHLVDFLVLSG